jgi:hypothetical protein
MPEITLKKRERHTRRNTARSNIPEGRAGNNYNPALASGFQHRRVEDGGGHTLNSRANSAASQSTASGFGLQRSSDGSFSSTNLASPFASAGNYYVTAVQVQAKAGNLHMRPLPRACLQLATLTRDHWPVVAYPLPLSKFIP